jgi:tRNA threonylcarbamoyladenosine biosynthesis protein TsaE
MQAPGLQISYSLSNIESAADQFWQYAHRYRVFTFSGSLGAGKTTFISALCRHLGVEDAVSSPTFALINEYHYKDHAQQDRIIYHMDWYRLGGEEEAINAGMEDTLLRPDSICFIEWPEKASGILPKEYLEVQIEATGMEEREMNVYVHTSQPVN